MPRVDASGCLLLGTSVASGIPTFRGEDPGSIWSDRTLRYGKAATFSKDPLRWYNDFWLAGVIPWRPFYAAQPNAAHHAIAELARSFPSVSVVSQNIDTLHHSAGTPERQLLLAHGNVEFFRCDRAANKSRGDCNARETRLNLHDYSDSQLPQVPSRVPPATLNRVPKCSVCGSGSLKPAILMFDEDYDDITWSTYEKWVNRANAIVFVGSSNAVGLTSDALKVAARGSVPVYNFNLSRQCMEAAKGPVYHVLGPAEETLPKLVSKVEEARITKNMGV